ncbi:MAG TPA: cytochrome c-type biogenesis protein CcmH [Caldilineaceae bacterium]|nr:cytochrome c-type biogenesis protein CcmH [Caldilineaceae bacterium]
MFTTISNRAHRRPNRWPRALWLALLLLALWAGSALAQSDGPRTAPADEVTADEVNAVARELWCPLCSGVRLDSCELKACEQMKEVIAIKLSEGEDTESIRAYFVEQYGPQVLGEPPRSGFNWLAWLLPVAGVIGGGLFFWRMTHRLVRPAGPGESRASNQPAPPQTPEDEYARKLEEELAKYG